MLLSRTQRIVTTRPRRIFNRRRLTITHRQDTSTGDKRQQGFHRFTHRPFNRTFRRRTRYTNLRIHTNINLSNPNHNIIRTLDLRATRNISMLQRRTSVHRRQSTTLSRGLSNLNRSHTTLGFSHVTANTHRRLHTITMNLLQQLLVATRQRINGRTNLTHTTSRNTNVHSSFIRTRVRYQQPTMTSRHN